MPKANIQFDAPTIGSFPGFKGLDDANPYLALFYQALAKEGIPWQGECNPWQCARTGKWPDILHLHWPELLWRDRPPDWVRIARRWPGGWWAYKGLRPIVDKAQMHGLFRLLEKQKAVGTRLVWTLHNTEPHEGAATGESWAYRELARLADLCIAHSQASLNDFAAVHDMPSRTVFMPHGNYDGVYPHPRERNEVLESVGLSPELPVVSCIGNIRHYKGVDLAIEAIGHLRGKVQLLIAGKPHSELGQPYLDQISERHEGVTLIPTFVDNQLFADLTAASSATLLPYRKVTSSGVLLASLTMGAGVIAADLPYFREVIGAEANSGRLFAPGNSTSLAQSIHSYLAVPAHVRRNAALRLAAAHEWASLIKPVAVAMRSITAH